ncbi:XRE family transcriptional regulator [Paraburkholderia sp. MM6662-R1]|uniref:XRE family transcriptional regulator n=1 Tax=Paraburkholderia sp. MM6662-R1 TaxID=2991066 RepID=UPI003D1A0B42
MSHADTGIDRDIGDLIRAHREKCGLTLTALQDLSGINNGSLSKIERGRQSLTNATIKALARAFDVSLPELFSDVNAAIVSHSADPGAPHKLVSEYELLSHIPENENVAIGTISIRPNAARGGIECRIDEHHAQLFYGGAIRDLNSLPGNLAAFEIEDDMMAPRLHIKDVVVADLGDKVIPATGGVFALVLDDEHVAVRRVLPYVGRGMRILCDNDHYPEITLTGSQAAAVTILGRIKHMRGSAGF